MTEQEISLRRFPSKAAVSAEVAPAVAQYAANCIAENGAFHVAFSGGSLPAIVCEQLAQQPLVASIDWRKWHVWLVDERCVSLQHADSSWRLLHEHLLSLEGVGIPLENLHPLPSCARFAAAPAPTGCAGEAERLVQQAAAEYAADLLASGIGVSGGMPALDLTLLGFGADGHTASLFPGRDHEDLRYHKAGSAWLHTRSVMTCITDSPKPPSMRISMTLPCLLASRRIFAIGCGSDKAPVMQALLGDGTIGGCGVGPVLPIAKVLFNHPNMSIWADDAACTPQ